MNYCDDLKVVTLYVSISSKCLSKYLLAVIAQIRSVQICRSCAFCVSAKAIDILRTKPFSFKGFILRFCARGIPPSRGHSKVAMVVFCSAFFVWMVSLPEGRGQNILLLRG